MGIVECRQCSSEKLCDYRAQRSGIGGGTEGAPVQSLEGHQCQACKVWTRLPDGCDSSGRM